MTTSNVQGSSHQGAQPAFDSFEIFAVDNRATLEALQAASSEFERRRGDVVGHVAPIARTDLRGGMDQVTVLRSLAEEVGFEVRVERQSLIVRIPGHDFGITVAVDPALHGQLDGEVRES